MVNVCAYPVYAGAKEIYEQTFDSEKIGLNEKLLQSEDLLVFQNEKKKKKSERKKNWKELNELCLVLVWKRHID